MIQTNTEYMSDKARAERVIRKFMNMTLGKLVTTQNRKCMEFITEEMISREGLSEEEIQNMTYLEFVRLIDGVGGNSDYDWYNHDSYAEQLTYYKMLTNAILNSSKVSIPVRLFMALPLTAFYSCLSDISGKNALLRELTRIKSRCKCNDDYTVRDFLSDKLSEANKVWVTIVPIHEYEEKMKAAHIDMGKVLVDSFCTAFSGFDMEVSLSKERFGYEQGEQEAAI